MALSIMIVICLHRKILPINPIAIEIHRVVARTATEALLVKRKRKIELMVRVVCQPSHILMDITVWLADLKEADGIAWLLVSIQLAFLLAMISNYMVLIRFF